MSTSLRAEAPDSVMGRSNSPATACRCLMRSIYSRQSIGTVFLLFALTFNTTGQLIQVPLPPASIIKKSSASTTARTKAVTPLTLPFWDDFSTTRKGFPDTTHWMNSASVSINDGTGINAPSLNVATFNGLDSLGVPYNPNEQTAKGFADRLISRPIKMGLSNISLSERDSVYLSFFYQWKGNQEPPDQYDFLRVEFKSNTGEWEPIETMYGDRALDERKFYSKIIKITAVQFFHDAFQFRIRSYGRLSGPFDTWNVDYIYLNKSRINTTNFPDQAIASPLTSLFGEYTSMPIWQFRSSKQLTVPSFGLHNLKSATGADPGIEPINYRILGEFSNFLNDSTAPLKIKKRIGPSTIAVSSSVLLPLESRVEPIAALPDVSDTTLFRPWANAIDITLKIIAFTGDVYDTAGVEASDYKIRTYELKHIVDFRVNDTLSTTYHLENYLAYDDGTAEFSVNLGQPGNRAALRFDLPIPADTLIGFYMYFPFYRGTASQTLDFFIYEDDNGKPAQNPVRSLFSRTITKNDSNAFVLIEMKFDPLIVQNTFYIAWKEPASERLHVGLDKSYSTSDKMYQNVFGTWEPAEDINGSLMIRPVFGSGTVIPPTGVPEERPDFAIHPNPNNGTFYINETVRDVEISDITGKRIGHHLESNGAENKISLSSVSAGVYIVRWKEKHGVQVRKIVVR